MQKFLGLLSLLVLATASVFAQGQIGEVRVAVDKNTIAVRVSANVPELNTLALQAFSAHGRYNVVASGFVYDIRFSSVGSNQVRVDVIQAAGNTSVVSQVVSGATARAALLRAADVAVTQTNGVGLRGFFTARIVFVGERTGKKEIYHSDLFFGEAKQVQPSNHPAMKPHWAPDGSRFIYTSFFKSGAADIFQYDLASFQRTLFVNFQGSNYGARVSPNGQQVAMVLTGEGHPEIYVSTAQGRQISRKTRSDQLKSSPCWSPDGSRLVFEMGEPLPQLYVMSASGGGVRRLNTRSAYAAEPDWSRTNPNKIACTVNAPGRKYQIAVYDETKDSAEIVSKASFDGIEPCWLADGRHLVYTARDNNTSVLCILDTETGKSRPISNGFGSAMQAHVWTP